MNYIIIWNINFLSNIFLIRNIKNSALPEINRVR